MTAVNYYATLLVRLDSVGETGDTCSLDRFILLWRELFLPLFPLIMNFVVLRIGLCP